MTEPALREQLHDAYADVHLDDSLDQVMRRGRRLRRTRRLPVLGGVTVVAAAALVLGLPGSQAPSAFATWTPAPRTLTAADSAAIQAGCRLGQEALPPVAISDARGHFAFTVFTDGVRWVDCERYNRNGFWREGGGGGGEVSQRRGVLDGTAPIAIEAAGNLYIGGDAAADVWGWVSARAVTVVVVADGRTTQATVRNGVFGAWWPHEGADSTGGQVTAYDATGARLLTIPLSFR